MKLFPIIAIALLTTMASCGKTKDAETTPATTTETDTTREAPRPGATESAVKVVKNVTQQQFDSLVKVADNGTVTIVGDRPVVIDFNASWCPPCLEFGPIYEEVAATRADNAVFISVDVDSCQQAAKSFGIQSIPQVSVVTPGGKVNSSVGLMSRSEFERFLNESLK